MDASLMPLSVWFVCVIVRVCVRQWRNVFVCKVYKGTCEQRFVFLPTVLTYGSFFLKNDGCSFERALSGKTRHLFASNT